MNVSMWLALAAFALTIVSLTLRRAREPVPRTILSPRDTLLPNISLEQAATLTYPPDLLPGARDVTTPYGTMRVYEWGPGDGDKVLFVHGDSTPAPILTPIAHNSAKKGCRIMMFGMWTRLASKPRATMGRPCKRVHCADQVYVKDLWGRGYSNTPLGVSHDARLYGMQTFFSTASSSLPWTGAESGGFSVVAFSLGAGIAMAFAAEFYYLINSIILLAARRPNTTTCSSATHPCCLLLI